MTERIKDYLLPIKIVCAEKCDDTEYLLRATDTQIFLLNEELCSVKSGGYIVLDFGKELHGGIRILNERSCTDIRIRFGESVAETFAELGENGACNDHSPRDIKAVVAGALG